MMKIKNKPYLLLYILRTTLFCVASLLLVAQVHAAVSAAGNPNGAVTSITAEQWELAREGEKVASLSQLKQVIRQWSSATGKLIEIHYPGGEEGEIWVNEIKGWLVSLGIASRYLMDVPGSGQDDVIRFKVINDGDSFSE